MTSVPVVRVIRSGLEESVHQVDIAVVDPEGRVTASAGDPARMLFARSAMKPLQATVSLSLAPFDFTDSEIAVMCASHNAEPVHVDAVRSLMTRAGVPESALRCPAVRPWDEESAIRAPERLAVNSDCSGKHAGMLAACVAQGWDLESYTDAGHPLQVAIRSAVERATGVGADVVGVDGCGVPVHALSLGSMARIYAVIASPGHLGELDEPARRAFSAMRREPYLVAGRNRPDTALMEVVPGVVAKGGAEGLICAALVEDGLGVAAKVRDGSHRAAGPALIHALASLGAVDAASLSTLQRYARPTVLGGGKPVGEIVAEFELVRA